MQYFRMGAIDVWQDVTGSEPITYQATSKGRTIEFECIANGKVSVIVEEGKKSRLLAYADGKFKVNFFSKGKAVLRIVPDDEEATVAMYRALTGDPRVERTTDKVHTTLEKRRRISPEMAFMEMKSRENDRKFKLHMEAIEKLSRQAIRKQASEVIDNDKSTEKVVANGDEKPEAKVNTIKGDKGEPRGNDASTGSPKEPRSGVKDAEG